MAELSIIELIVYGIVGYTGIVLLVSSAFREIPSGKSGSVIRSIWVLAPLFCMYMLAQAGQTIVFQEITEIGYNATVVNEVILNSTTVNSITLIQPVWVTLHGLFFTMLLIFFIWNMLQLFVKR